MKSLKFFRCSKPQPWEDEKINAIQQKLFIQMLNTMGEVRGNTGIEGVRLDFNCGLRLEISVGRYHVRIGHALSEEIFFDGLLENTLLVSEEKYAIAWKIEIHRDKELIFAHIFNPAEQPVLLHCSSKALGDTLAFLPYARLYRDKFRAQVCCWVDDYLKDIVKHLYPDIPQVTEPTDTYATFFLGTWKKGFRGAPVNGFIYPLTMMAGAITGLYDSPPLATACLPFPRTIHDPYICIGVQASTPRKGWHYPRGWEILTAALQQAGYRVICIDRHTITRADGYESCTPPNAEDLTGDYTLLERAQLLAHAACFVGLSSGLAWLAHSLNCPVVMISGMSAAYYEFSTPYRVVNRLVCHDCFCDPGVDFMFDKVCPYFHGTKRELECSKSITPAMVLEVITKALGKA